MKCSWYYCKIKKQWSSEENQRCPVLELGKRPVLEKNLECFNLEMVIQSHGLVGTALQKII